MPKREKAARDSGSLQAMLFWGCSTAAGMPQALQVLSSWSARRQSRFPSATFAFASSPHGLEGVRKGPPAALLRMLIRDPRLVQGGAIHTHPTRPLLRSQSRAGRRHRVHS